MAKYQKYCTHCGKKIEELVLDRKHQKRFHPMKGQEQFRRVWMRRCPEFMDLFSEHYSFEKKWEWVDVNEKLPEPPEPSVVIRGPRR